MRVALTLLLLAACQSTLDNAGIGDDMGNAPLECNMSADCAAGAAKCCDCPTYAAPKTDSAISGCSGVACPAMNCPMNVAPSCSPDHQCVLACVAMACSNTCDDGFAVDANGCLSCECAQVGARECLGDNNCAEAPADCCGCAKGGADTSVPADQLATYEASLACSPTPSCPGNNTCDAAMQPACVQGTCSLVPALDANACGRTDLAACTGGAVCAINLPGGNPANDHRVGECTQTLP
jgi:hypothetical protein